MGARNTAYIVCVLVLMLLAFGLGRRFGGGPAAPAAVTSDEPSPPPAARRPAPEKKAAPKKPGLNAPRLLNLDDLQANIRKYYPEAEHAAGKPGHVMLAMVVGADGSVSGIRVETSGGADFDEAAKKVAAAMRFSPARRAGRPVAVEINEGVDFEYEGK